MTIATTASLITVQGNGVTTVFDFNFIIPSNSDGSPALAVWYTVSGVPTLLATNAYSVAGLDNPAGGAVTFAPAGQPIVAGTYLSIIRTVPYTQPVAVPNQAFYPVTVEEIADMIVEQIQQLNTESEYSIRAPLTDPIALVELPSAANRAMKLLGFDSTGQIELYTPTGGTPVPIVIDESNGAPASDIVTTPTGSESDGTRYLIANSPTGVFLGKGGLLAIKVSGVWIFSVPGQGQQIYVIAANRFYVYRNTWWNKVLSQVPNAIYQDYADVPNGTSVSSLVLASGQTMIPQGPGAAATVVNNGRIEPTDNMYCVITYPYKNLRMKMRGAWRTGVSPTGSCTLAAGTYDSLGRIINIMVHTEYLYQGPGNMSLWGGPRVTGSNPFLATADIYYQYHNTDGNYPTETLGAIFDFEQYINGCNAKCHGANGYWLDSYTDPMISGLCGNNTTAGTLGYIYFQSGGVTGPNNPYIYLMLAEPVPATEDEPNPQFINSGSLAITQTFSATPLFGGGAQEICRFKPGNFSAYCFAVDAVITGAGTLPGYAMANKRWTVNVVNYNSTILTTVAVTANESQTTQSSGVAQYSNSLTASATGDTVIFQSTPTRTGTDSTATCVVSYRITPIYNFSLLTP